MEMIAVEMNSLEFISIQIKISLTTENEALNCRLAEAQSKWLETREENLKTEERFKRLENEVSSFLRKRQSEIFHLMQSQVLVVRRPQIVNHKSFFLCSSASFVELEQSERGNCLRRKSGIFQETRRTERATVPGNVTRNGK
jgi:predicted nuclease with TOPRIM domain